jgi:IMP dehydrogenase
VGVPQITAIDNVAKALRGTGVPLIADGGMRYSGDVAKAIAAGADTVMMGGAFAGTDEAPGDHPVPGPQLQELPRHGFDGRHARAAPTATSRIRAATTPTPASWCPRASRARCPTRARWCRHLFQMAGGLRASMHYCGCASIADMQSKAEFVEITSAGMRESHVHDVQITKEAPNYRRVIGPATPRGLAPLPSLMNPRQASMAFIIITVLIDMVASG